MSMLPSALFYIVWDEWNRNTSPSGNSNMWPLGFDNWSFIALQPVFGVVLECE